jgi:hypothetical protein
MVLLDWTTIGCGGYLFRCRHTSHPLRIS